MGKLWDKINELEKRIEALESKKTPAKPTKYVPKLKEKKTY